MPPLGLAVMTLIAALALVPAGPLARTFSSVEGDTVPATSSGADAALIEAAEAPLSAAWASVQPSTSKTASDAPYGHPPAPTTASPANPAPTPAPTPQALVSDVLPLVRPPDPPAAERGGSATSLAVPAGTRVVRGSCASDGECHDYNFYWAPTHEAVVFAAEPAHKVQHELCHAHQHWSINRGAALAPSDYDLESWYASAEGQSFTAAVAGLYWPWSQSAINGLEDFAWTCAYWYVDPGHLRSVSPLRYAWAAAHLP